MTFCHNQPRICPMSWTIGPRPAKAVPSCRDALQGRKSNLTIGATSDANFPIAWKAGARICTMVLPTLRVAANRREYPAEGTQDTLVD